MTRDRNTLAEAGITPLGMGAWISRLDALARDCADAAPAEQPQLLREAVAVLRLAPLRAATPFGPVSDLRRFETLIGARAYESAALALLGDEAGYIVSRGEGAYLASVILPGMAEDITAEAASAALALMSAQAAALATVARCGGIADDRLAERPFMLN